MYFYFKLKRILGIIKKKIIMLGAGGHAKVIFDIASITGIKISYIVDNKDQLDPVFSRIKHIMNDEYISNNMPENKFALINGLGVVPGVNKFLRSNIYNYYKKKKYEFLKIIHPKAIIASNVEIENGVNIMAGVVIQTSSIIMENSIINTGVLIDHDCVIDQNVHIAPGAILCGNVRVGKGSFIGAGAKILPGVIIPENSIVKSGTLLK